MADSSDMLGPGQGQGWSHHHWDLTGSLGSKHEDKQQDNSFNAGAAPVKTQIKVAAVTVLSVEWTTIEKYICSIVKYFIIFLN